MGRYLVRRLLYTIPVLFGVSLIVFILFHGVAGDPVIIMLGKHASEMQVRELRHELGFDQSLGLQFLNYLKQVATFDFGRSFATRENIGSMIWNGMGPSFLLASLGFFSTLILSLIISIACAFYRGRWFDRGVGFICVVGMSVSALAYILFGQYVLAFQWGWFPISGYENGFPANLKYLAMPVLIWVLVSLGWDVRFFRAALLDEAYKDYVRTARSKGLSEVTIFYKHILKNAMIPIVTYVVIQVPFLLLGSFLLESFFSIPGIGYITVDAIRSSDFPVIKATTTLISIMMVFGNLLTDIIYTLVDPRVRLR